MSNLVEKVAAAIYGYPYGHELEQASAAIKVMMQDQIGWSVGYDWRQALARYARDRGITLDTETGSQP